MKLKQSIAWLLTLTCVAAAKPLAVTFTNDEIVECNATGDRDGLRQTILDYWQAYQSQDRQGLLATLRPDVTRLCKQAGPAQYGSAQVLQKLPDEWSAFEQKRGKIASKLTIKNANLRVSGQAAYATYWIESKGGGRWDYVDQALVYQTLVRPQGKWQISHQTESWSLDYDLEEDQPGAPTLEFDYVYPVSKLSRALEFYKPLLGAPECVNEQGASFNLGGPRFQLQVNPLQGLSQCRPGFPSGYAVFRVPDVQAIQQRLRKAGTPFYLGTGSKFRLQGPDRYVVVGDPSGNLMVLLQRCTFSDTAGIKPSIVGFNGKDPYVLAAGRVAQAWMTTSPTALRAVARPDCRWFDDTRTRGQGQQRGLPNVQRALQNVYWPSYDRSRAGLQARLQVTSIQVSPQPQGALVSYQACLTGLGSHPFRETSLVTQRFGQDMRLIESFTVGNDKPPGPVRDLDYTGYPVTDVERSARFYSNLVKLGGPYEDTDYLGWWSTFAVFGIYKASLRQDGLPQAGRANGYASFWVASAQQAYQYAKKHGSRFPVIPAINSTSGISSEPGYQQLYTTDSEGNGLIFTEYTGLTQ